MPILLPTSRATRFVPHLDPSSSTFNTQSFNVWMHSIFDVFRAAVNSHCFSNTSTRWSYVSFLAASRLVNHSSAPLLNAMLFFRQLILSFPWYVHVCHFFSRFHKGIGLAGGCHLCYLPIGGILYNPACGDR